MASITTMIILKMIILMVMIMLIITITLKMVMLIIEVILILNSLFRSTSWLVCMIIIKICAGSNCIWEGNYWFAMQK